MKLHENHMGQKVVAVSESGLVGKHIEDNEKGMDVLVSKEFYGENEVELDEIVQHIIATGNANIMGSGIVDALIEKKVIDPEHIIRIGDIKHAQIYNLDNLG